VGLVDASTGEYHECGGLRVEAGRSG